MRLAVITPVGPGHEGLAQRAIASVAEARVGQFTSIRHVIVEDSHGQLGRSRARNIGMETKADWFFFLDADDVMRPYAPRLCDFTVPATFGAVSLDGKRLPENVYPCGWKEIVRHGAHGTLAMGCFVRADVARALRFNETLDAGEDFDFYMRLPCFTKVDRPLIDIGYASPSAGGPRGYDKLDWTAVCNDIIARYVAADPRRFDLGGDAVLAAAGGVKPQSGDLARPLPA